MIREVVEADLGAAGRVVLHRRVAEALEALPGQPAVEVLAYHFMEGDAPRQASAYLERAGDRAVTKHANAAAEGYYRALVEQQERLGQWIEAAAAREKLGTTQIVLARHDVALDTLETAVAVYEEIGDLEGVTRVVARIGRVHLARGTLEEGILRLQPVPARVEARGAVTSLAALTVALAGLQQQTLADHAVAQVERAVDLARAAGDARLLAQADVWAGRAFDMAGRSDAARALLRDAVGLAEGLDDLHLLSQALQYLAWVDGAAGEFAAGRSCAARALDAAEQLGSPSRIQHATGLVGHLAYHMGDWGEARTYLERAVAMARELGTVIRSFGWLGELDIAAGRWDDAARILEEDRVEAIRSGDYREVLAAECKLAELDLLQGRPDAAYRRMVPFGSAIARAEAWVLQRLAWIHLSLGDWVQATVTSARAVTSARKHDRMNLGEVLRIQALVAIVQARWDQAERAR